MRERHMWPKAEMYSCIWCIFEGRNRITETAWLHWLLRPHWPHWPLTSH